MPKIFSQNNTMDELKQNQDCLRRNLIAEVESYLGYADDVHADYISVNEKTFAVGFRSRKDQRGLPDLEYYNVLDLMERDGLWFKPDIKTIEAVVQEHLPSPNIEAKFMDWSESIKSFLVAERPTALHSCRLSIGTESASLDCFDEAKETIAEASMEELDSEDFLTAESVDILPMRKVVTKTSTGYTISGYQLTKLILKYIEPNNI